MTRSIPVRVRTDRMSGLAALLLAGVWAGAATPQEEAGRSLTIGTSLGAVANDNLSLDADSEGSTVGATAGLDFALRLATPIQNFALLGDLGLRTTNGPDEDAASDGLSRAGLRLNYSRTVRDSRLSFSGYLSRREVAFLDPLGSDLTGGIVDPDDIDPIDVDPADPSPGDLDDPLILDELDAASRSGTQIGFGLETELELRRTAPIGIVLSAGLSGLRYDGTDAPDLTDEDRHRAGIGLRFRFDRITTGAFDVDYRSFEDDDILDEGDEDIGEGRRDTVAVSGGVTRLIPTGTIGASADFVSTEDGERYVLSVSRSLSLPLWTLSGRLGVTRTENGDLLPTGTLRVDRDLRLGGVSLDLTRSVLSGSDDEERRVTGVSFDFTRQLTPLTSMGLDLSYLRSEATGAGAGQTESFGTAAIRVSHVLSEDWSLNLGLAHRIEDEGFAERAHDNRVSVDLRRQVTFRP